MYKDLVFIVSGGRTGTTFFGSCLAKIIADCFSVHEPDLWDGFTKRSLLAVKTFGIRHMIIDRLRQRTGIRNLTIKYLSGDWPEQQIQDAVRAHRDRYYQGIEAGLIIEAYSQWYGLLPVIRTIYPDAKIVGIVRDPREWVRSWMNYGAHHDENDLVTRFGQSRLTPSIVDDADYAERWSSMSQFERLCWDWRIVNSTIRDFAENDILTRIYRFEDLFSNPIRTLKVHNFLEFITNHNYKKYLYTLVLLCYLALRA
ncbi:MAG: hypothetical protein GVY22_13540 [Gammaproteobacteria bacterium]|jgi:hypothetical protein|nr:hypothetical protein [Gammaproteobacteria bacterium]